MQGRKGERKGRAERYKNSVCVGRTSVPPGKEAQWGEGASRASERASQGALAGEPAGRGPASRGEVGARCQVPHSFPPSLAGERATQG